MEKNYQLLMIHGTNLWFLISGKLRVNILRVMSQNKNKAE